MGFIDFTNGEVLTADQMDLVMRQGIMRFADAAARDTALSEVLAEGMMAYLDDTDEVLKYDGTDWIDISGDITGVTAGTALTGGGTSGNVTLDVDESALTIAQSQVTDLTTDLADKQDDVITTQGDLVIGDASGDPVRLPVGSADQVLTSDGTTVSFQTAGGGGFNTVTEVTASDSSFDVSGISGFARFTLVGGGGGGGNSFNLGTDGTAGGNTSITISATTTTATGGKAGTTSSLGGSGQFDFASSNNGGGRYSENQEGTDGGGGEVKIFYADLTGVSSINISIGAGGLGGTEPDQNGFRGVVVLEYTS